MLDLTAPEYLLENVEDSNDRMYCVYSKKYNPIYLKCIGSNVFGYIFQILDKKGMDIFSEQFDLTVKEAAVVDELCEHPHQAMLHVRSENIVIHIVAYLIIKTKGKIRVISTQE